jgi:hypothetical protein
MPFITWLYFLGTAIWVCGLVYKNRGITKLLMQEKAQLFLGKFKSPQIAAFKLQ